jgi:hypothetical protein
VRQVTDMSNCKARQFKRHRRLLELEQSGLKVLETRRAHGRRVFVDRICRHLPAIGRAETRRALD